MSSSGNNEGKKHSSTSLSSRRTKISPRNDNLRKSSNNTRIKKVNKLTKTHAVKHNVPNSRRNKAIRYGDPIIVSQKAEKRSSFEKYQEDTIKGAINLSNISENNDNRSDIVVKTPNKLINEKANPKKSRNKNTKGDVIFNNNE